MIEYDPKYQHENRLERPKVTAEIVLLSQGNEALIAETLKKKASTELVEPTAEQCSTNAQLPDYGERKAFACWYPQMGGYGSKCVIVTYTKEGNGSDDNCFDAFIWHDGDFPFNEGDPPVELHHCSTEQFIEFGQLVKKLQGAT